MYCFVGILKSFLGISIKHLMKIFLVAPLYNCPKECKYCGPIPTETHLLYFFVISNRYDSFFIKLLVKTINAKYSILDRSTLLLGCFFG